ncbi:MAG: hypothetical protein A2381_16920 [Bdellovibrionales bacterium RIFOXYB1_FULL_37_110]|nr:MAG: hypothetical protein A2181_07925 [Bdellovibrionales bacterium RIFOXYA1_FULL_38_20]OFZ50081.1 MAG: hypothetical protein A2417_18755 [Bdellovibrionales bacterium RIFOXYC1_FULL_37_79]OFZ59987.1 MAG: hypothetical protein A2381_16920 [Bdellovibrionales bacterium RIFOXYB1_FULL_37_110]OFZ63958.1 MAG: hypothetical protein A2577_06110 [Bdellovibrionales bacterium RIFOXYD1_FULL_36_51]
MIIRVILSVLLLSFPFASMSLNLRKELLTDLGIDTKLDADTLLPLTKASEETEKNDAPPFDCTPYLKIKDTKNSNQWANKSCFDGTNYPMDASTVAGQLGVSKNFDDWYREDLNRELQRDAFKVTWENRKIFRDLYPDIPIQESEIEAKKCGMKMVECQKDDQFCSQDQELKSMLTVEPEKKPFNDEGKDKYYKDHVKRAVILSAYLDALNDLKTIRDVKEREAFKEKLLLGIDSFSSLFPLLFKSDNYPFERKKNVSINSVQQFLTMKDFKNPHQLSDLGNLIIKNVDPEKKLRRKYIELFKAGKTDLDSNIEKEIFEQKIDVYSGYEDSLGRRTTNRDAKSVTIKKSVADYLKDSNFMKRVEHQTKVAAGGYLDFLGQGANFICERKHDDKPVFHLYPELVKRTMSRIEDKFKQEYLDKDKNKVLFDFNYTRMKAVYCFTKQKYPAVDADTSDLLLMGALGLGGGALMLPFAAPATAFIVGGLGFAAAGFKDVGVSDRTYVAMAGLQLAKTAQLSEYYKASGYTTALAGVDTIAAPMDGIALTKYFFKGKSATKGVVEDVAEVAMKKASRNLKMEEEAKKIQLRYKFTDEDLASLELSPEDKFWALKLFDYGAENVAKADTYVKQALQEAEINPETNKLFLAVLGKVKADLESAGKLKNVSVENIYDYIEESLNRCMRSKAKL